MKHLKEKKDRIINVGKEGKSSQNVAIDVGCSQSAGPSTNNMGGCTRQEYW